MIRLITLNNRYFLRLMKADALAVVAADLDPRPMQRHFVRPDLMEISPTEYLRLLARTKSGRNE